jgi:hypothetical protein
MVVDHDVEVIADCRKDAAVRSRVAAVKSHLGAALVQMSFVAGVSGVSVTHFSGLGPKACSATV